MKNIASRFKAPSRVSGIAKILDIGATYDNYNNDLLSHTADYEALVKDWQAIGNDFKRALSSYDKQIKDKTR